MKLPTLREACAKTPLSGTRPFNSSDEKAVELNPNLSLSYYDTFENSSSRIKLVIVFESKMFFANPRILIVAAPAVIDFWKRNKDYNCSIISYSIDAPVLM